MGDGPLLDLTGDGGTDGLVDVDLGGGDLLDLGETGSILDLDGNGDLLDLGSNGTLLDLGGNGDLLDLGTTDDLVALDLGNARIDATLNLDDGDEPLAEVTGRYRPRWCRRLPAWLPSTDEQRHGGRRQRGKRDALQQ